MRWAEKKRNSGWRCRWEDLTRDRATPVSDIPPRGWVPSAVQRERAGEWKAPGPGEKAKGSREPQVILGARLIAWEKQEDKDLVQGIRKNSRRGSKKGACDHADRTAVRFTPEGVQAELWPTWRWDLQIPGQGALWSRDPVGFQHVPSIKAGGGRQDEEIIESRWCTYPEQYSPKWVHLSLPVPLDLIDHCFQEWQEILWWNKFVKHRIKHRFRWTFFLFCRTFQNLYYVNVSLEMVMENAAFSRFTWSKNPFSQRIFWTSAL